MKARVPALCLLLAALSLGAPALWAATPAERKAKLRELAVLPTLHLTSEFGFSLEPDPADAGPASVEDRIATLREELRRGPETLELELELGSLLERSDEAAAAERYRRAVELGRKEVERRPMDGRQLGALSRALLAAGEPEEAERTARRAVEVAPNDCPGWQALGSLLDQRAIEALLPGRGVARRLLSLEALPPRLPTQPPTAEALAKCESRGREAAACYDRTVALAPRDPEVYFRRASHRCSAALVETLARHFRGEARLEVQGLARAFFTPQALPDLQAAAQLDPANYRLLGSAAWFEWFSAKFQLPAARIEFSLADLPEKSQASIRAVMARLEELGAGTNRVAAGALETLAMLKVAARDASPGLKTNLQRALVLDPTRERAWDLLLGLCTDSTRPEEATALCQARLQTKDSPRNHLLLAKALARQGLWGPAADQAETTLRQQGGDLAAHLLLAAIELRRSADETRLTRAASHLYHAQQLLQRLPEGPDKAERWREFSLNSAILNALSGELPAARRWAQAALKGDPADATAKRIIEALGP